MGDQDIWLQPKTGYNIKHQLPSFR